MPPLFRAAVGTAGAGLKDAAKATRWPRGLGPVDLEALLRPPATVSEEAAVARLAQAATRPLLGFIPQVKWET